VRKKGGTCYTSKVNGFAQPALLNLFDTHYLPLQSGLRPLMKSFIIALLPGLEEETSEFFDKVTSGFSAREAVIRT